MAYVVGKCLLRSIRKQAGMSQIDLAGRLGKPKQTIYKYEKNIRTMSAETMYNVSVILDCNMEDLYEWVLKK